MLALGVAERPRARLCARSRARYPTILADPAVGGRKPALGGEDGGVTTSDADRPAAGEPAVGRDRFETILLLVVWVLPVLVAAGLLVAVGLAWFAFALVAIEATVGLIVAAVRRRPERSAGPSRHPWVVPAVLIGVLLALLAGTLLLTSLD